MESNVAEAEKKGSCFVIMPISTPDHWVPKYGGDKDHFDHVLAGLFSPALEAAGFEVSPPKASGSEINGTTLSEADACSHNLCTGDIA